MDGRKPSLAEMGTIVVLLVFAGIFAYVSAAKPQNTPEITIRDLFKAASDGDISRLRLLCTSRCYAVWEKHYSETRRREIAARYQWLLNAGRQDWQVLREKMESNAAGEYDKLHVQVEALGRAAFQRLPSSQKMVLVDDPKRQADFMFRTGFDSLPQEVRTSIPDSEAFRQRRDREEFIDRHGWEALSEDDRTLAGRPAALAREDSEAKFALLERLGRASLSEEQQRDLENQLRGVTRAEANSPVVFQQKYGEAALRDALRASGLSADVQAPATYLTQQTGLGYFYMGDTRGRILQGHEIVYNVQATRRREDQVYSEPHWFLLTRGETDSTGSRFAWRIAAPAPTNDGGTPLL